MGHIYRNFLNHSALVCLSLVLLAMAGPVAAQSSQPPQPGIEHFGDWGRQCEALPGGQRPQCFLYQNIYLKQNRKKLLYIAVGYFGAAQTLGAIVQVPLGLYLPAGLTIELPDAKPLRIVLEICLRAGCRASVTLAPDTIEAFKRGGRAVVKLQDARKRVVALPLSLNGFAQGFARLQNR